jgi:hypothetical protein
MNKLRKGALSIVLIILLSLSIVSSIAAKSKIRAKSIALNVDTATISIGDVITLSAVMKPTNSTDTVKWSSDNNSVATVNKYGVVTGLSEGTATITAKTSSKKKASMNITITKSLSQKEIESLINKNLLSIESIEGLIKKNSLSEAQIKNLIQKNSITEDRVKEIVKNNAISEDQLNKALGNIQSENTNLVIDGAELKCIGPSFPLTIDNNIKINSITVTQHIIDDNNCFVEGELSTPYEIYRGEYSKYEYVIDIKGELLTDKNALDDRYFRVYLDSGEEQDKGLGQAFGKVDIKKSDINPNNSFHITETCQHAEPKSNFYLSHIYFEWMD